MLYRPSRRDLLKATVAGSALTALGGWRTVRFAGAQGSGLFGSGHHAQSTTWSCAFRSSATTLIRLSRGPSVTTLSTFNPLGS